MSKKSAKAYVIFDTIENVIVDIDFFDMCRNLSSGEFQVGKQWRSGNVALFTTKLEADNALRILVDEESNELDTSEDIKDLKMAIEDYVAEIEPLVEKCAFLKAIIKVTAVPSKNRRDAERMLEKTNKQKEKLTVGMKELQKELKRKQKESPPNVADKFKIVEVSIKI